MLSLRNQSVVLRANFCTIEGAHPIIIRLVFGPQCTLIARTLAVARSKFYKHSEKLLRSQGDQVLSIISDPQNISVTLMTESPYPPAKTTVE